MSSEEMEQFLISIGGLKNGRFSDRPIIKSPIFFSVGEGWYSIIKELIEDLIELGWDKKIYQVKEKFGGLRFYITNSSDEINDRILKAELLSYKTCEVTGKRGELRNDLDWVRTLCEEEYKKAKEN